MSVEFVYLGRSDLRISKIGLGTMTFGTGEGFAGLRPKVDADLARKMVARAIDRGVNFFDSSGGYNGGQAEAFLGEAIRGCRERVVVSTKDPVAPPALGGPARAQIAANVEASLGRLGVEAIDLYQVGLVELDQDLEDVALGLDDVIRRGLVRHAGVTNLPAWRLERLAAFVDGEGLAPIVAAQMSYSLLERNIEFEFGPLLAERGIGVVAWSPLAGGFLTGKYIRRDPEGGGGRLSRFRLQPIDRERGHRVVEVLEEIGSERGASPAAVAISWAASRPLVGTAVFGATTLERLEENLAAAEITLSPEEARRLDDVSAPPKPYPYWIYPVGGTG